MIACSRLLRSPVLECGVENALRAFSTPHSIICAAKPREYPARESEESESQTGSNNHYALWVEEAQNDL
jgi:hypothetical protein